MQVTRAALLSVVVVAAACGGRPAPAPRADRPTLSPSWVVGMAADPAGVARVVDPARGLVLVRSLGCEREPAIEEAQHLCGAPLDAEAATLHERLARAVRLAESFGDGVACTANGRCQIPPTSECDAAYELVFVDDRQRGPVLIGVIERDDWQHPDSPEVDAELREVANRIDVTFAAARAGCDP